MDGLVQGGGSRGQPCPSSSVGAVLDQLRRAATRPKGARPDLGAASAGRDAHEVTCVAVPGRRPSAIRSMDRRLTQVRRRRQSREVRTRGKPGGDPSPRNRGHRGHRSRVSLTHRNLSTNGGAALAPVSRETGDRTGDKSGADRIARTEPSHRPRFGGVARRDRSPLREARRERAEREEREERERQAIE